MTFDEVWKAFTRMYEATKPNSGLYLDAFITIDEVITEWFSMKKRLEQFRWHDLREDPTDLPEHNGKVNGRFVTYEVIYDESFLKGCNHGFACWQGDGWSSSWKIIKWREIDHEGDE